MSLRARLTAAFVVVVALPLLLTAVLLVVTVPQAADNRTRASVSGARAVAVSRLQTACQQATAAALLVAQAGGGTVATGNPQPTLDAIRQATGVDAVLQVDTAGQVVSTSFPDGAPRDTSSRLTNATDCHGTRIASIAGAVVARQPFTASAAGGSSGTALAAVSLTPLGANDGILDELLDGSGARTTLLLPGQDPLGSRIGPASQFAATFPTTDADRTNVSRSGGYLASAIAFQGGARLIVSEHRKQPAGAYVALGIGSLVALAIAFLAGWELARRATHPLAEITAAARKVADGDLTATLPAQAGTEVGELSAAFNDMTHALQTTIDDLRSSHEELRRGVSRLGSALSGTHDLDRILAVILDTAMGTVRATAGALLLTSASGESLYVGVARNLTDRVDGDAENWTVATSSRGVIARIATGGVTVHGVVGQDVDLAPDEPRCDTVLGLPMRSAGRITGVVCVYDRADGKPFDDRDAAAISDFVNQATAAVDNVLMHHETQRLSVTDGLTGLWNYRYASRALGREVERSQRYGHPLAVLMLDLDRFKRVNDQYGHQRGDAVLVELAARVREVVREIDTVARYGGEELILILPETDLPGARLLSSRILQGVRSEPIGGPGEEPIWMTTSIGLAVMPLHGDSAESLIRAADTALYAAKTGGRDTFRIAAQLPRPTSTVDRVTADSPERR